MKLLQVSSRWSPTPAYPAHHAWTVSTSGKGIRFEHPPPLDNNCIHTHRQSTAVLNMANTMHEVESPLHRCCSLSQLGAAAAENHSSGAPAGASSKAHRQEYEPLSWLHQNMSQSRQCSFLETHSFHFWPSARQAAASSADPSSHPCNPHRHEQIGNTLSLRAHITQQTVILHSQCQHAHDPSPPADSPSGSDGQSVDYNLACSTPLTEPPPAPKPMLCTNALHAYHACGTVYAWMLHTSTQPCNHIPAAAAAAIQHSCWLGVVPGKPCVTPWHAKLSVDVRRLR
jgi:hypothetical protein